MQKRTTIFLDDADLQAIETIKAEHASRGTPVTASGAIRYALREASRRLEQAARKGAARSGR